MGNERLGKYMSFVLRHDPEHIGMKMDKSGWLNLEEMIEGINSVEKKFNLTKEMVEKEVLRDKKGRFEISSDGKMIRCVQGHSKGIVSLDYQEITDVNSIPQYLFHGTKFSVKEAIQNNGLKKQLRDYVHLIEDRTIAIENAERWKENQVLVFYVDVRQMCKDGIKILKSNNNVWLVEYVDPKYLVKLDILENKNAEIKPKKSFRKKI